MPRLESFSILERIDVGETYALKIANNACSAFSILERIDVGETSEAVAAEAFGRVFQYPRTDRRG